MEKLKIIVGHVLSSDEAVRKRVAVGAVSAAAVLVLAAGAWLAWYLTPPAMPETPEDAKAVLASARFQRLGGDAKQPYYDVIRERWGRDREFRRMVREDEDARDAARDMMRQMMGQRLDTYMLAGPEERAAMMEEGMGFGRPRGGEGRGGREGGGPPGGRDSGAMRERMSDRLGNGSAQRGAAMGEMIRQRREQRQQREGG